MNRFIMAGLVAASWLLTGCGLSTENLPAGFVDVEDAFDDTVSEPAVAESIDPLDPDQQPYPYRTNPFVPLVGATEVTSSSVQVKGFVDVERPLAMLSIDDRVVLVAPGDQVADLKIVSVEPPGIVVEQHNATRRLTLRR